MEDINFMTIGDKDYFPILNFSIKQIMRIYPNSKFYIYDWGFTTSQRKRILKYPITILIDWNDKIKRNSEYKSLPKEFEGYNPTFDARKLTYLFMQKPYCILDCAKRVKKNLFFIDADAFLINKIDEIFSWDFEIGITMFPKNRIQRYKKINFIVVLSSGVIFFKIKSEKMQFFINEWIKEMHRSYRWCIEQTALTLLLEKNNPTLFDDYYNSEVVTLSNIEFKVKILPYDIYNLFILTREFNPKEVKILHLASFVFQLQQFNRKLSIQLHKNIESIKFQIRWRKILKIFPKSFKETLITLINKDYLKKYLVIHPFSLYWFLKILISLLKLFWKRI